MLPPPTPPHFYMVSLGLAPLLKSVKSFALDAPLSQDFSRVCILLAPGAE